MTQKKRIGVDLDRIFVGLPPLIPPTIIDMFYKKSNGELRYRVPGNLEKEARILSHASFLRPPIRENLYFLSKIHEKNPEIYLISSRFSFLKKKTEKLIEKYNIRNYFKKMYFNYNDEQPHLFKDKILKSLKLNIFIDDDLDLLLYLSKENSNVNFFFLNKNNGILKNLPRNIKQIQNLEEFYNNYL